MKSCKIQTEKTYAENVFVFVFGVWFEDYWFDLMTVVKHILHTYIVYVYITCIHTYVTTFAIMKHVDRLAERRRSVRSKGGRDKQTLKTQPISPFFSQNVPRHIRTFTDILQYSHDREVYERT